MSEKGGVRGRRLRESDASTEPADAILADCMSRYAESRRLMQLRSTYEAPIEVWGSRLTSRDLRGKRWKAFLDQGRRAVAEASSLYREIRNKQQQALEILRRLREEGPEHAGDPATEDVNQLLSDSVQVHAVELEWLDGLLEHSHALVNFPPSTSRKVVLGQVDQRKGYVTRLDALESKSQALRTDLCRALGFSPPSPASSESGRGTREGGKEDLNRIEPRASKVPHEKPNQAEPEPPTAPAADTKETTVAEATQKADQSRPSDTSKKGEGSGATPAAPAHERLLAHVERLSKDLQHVTKMAKEARAEAEKDRDRRLEEAREQHEKRIDELDRSRKELEGRVQAALDEMKDLRKQVTDAQASEKEMRKALNLREMEMAEEHREVSKERERIQQQMKEANQERDEALVLVASLTRRLKTPGLDRAMRGSNAEATARSDSDAKKGDG